MDLDELKRLAEAATPGPWRVHEAWSGPDRDAVVRTIRDRSKLSREVAITTTGDVTDDKEAANSVFIAAANPQRVLAMLAVIEAAKAMRGDGYEPRPNVTKVQTFDAALSALEEA